MWGELPSQINQSRKILLRMCTKQNIPSSCITLVYITIIPVGVCFSGPSMQRTKISTNSWPALLNWLFRRCKGEASSFTSGPFLSCDVHLVKSLSLGSIPSIFLEKNSLHLKKMVFGSSFVFLATLQGFGAALLFQQGRRYMNQSSPGCQKEHIPEINRLNSNRVQVPRIPKRLVNRDQRNLKKPQMCLVVH